MLTHIKALTFGRFFAVLASLALPVVPAAASAPDTISYTVIPNDTLYGIARRYLVNDESALRVQRFNAVRNPRRLSIDRTLLIPRELLRHQPVELRVAAFSGPVAIGGNAPIIGSILSEGAIVETGRNGFISFAGGFGGRISLPSNTTARLIKARRYVLGDTLDVDFAVSRGRANATSPALEGQDRLRMRTPVAVTAVRGTQFRVAYDPETGDSSLTEVTEGEVQVAAGGQERAAPAGFGVSSSASGVSEPEELLPSPEFRDPGAVQTSETLNFAIEPVAGAAGYRVQLARDAGFLDVVTEQMISTEAASIPSIENGRYFVRARSISQSGLEGSSESYSFLRKRVGVAAAAGSSPDYDGFNFSWIPEGGENASFAFQMWLEADPSTLLVDEIGLDTRQVILTDLAPGKYVWRVAASETDPQEGLIKVWGPAQTLIVSQ
jgi:hypothetical protein